MKLLALILSILLPPAGVALRTGLSGHVLINVILTLLGYVPGLVHALYHCLTDPQPAPPSPPSGQSSATSSPLANCLRNRRGLTRLQVQLALAIGLIICVLFSPRRSPPAGGPPASGPDFQSGQNGLQNRPTPSDVSREAPGGTRHFGYTPNPEGTRQFLRTLSRPEIRGAQNTQDAGPGLRVRAGEPVLLYRALNRAWDHVHPGQKWTVGRQGIGDCVSWGWCHAVDTHLAVMWCLGETSEWRPAATEAVYGGSRVEARGKPEGAGGYSDGSYGGAAAKWVSEWGILFRQPYRTARGEIDLSSYSATRAKEWGAYGCGGQGDGGQLDAIAKTHPVRNVALVKTFDAAAAAIQSGYPVAVCSGQGFSSQRDARGFAAASGSWSHCMCFVGVRFDPDGLLCLNSWGPGWIAGPKWPDDQPDGSFWVARATCDRMLSGGDSFAVSGYEGFPYRQLDNKWVRRLRWNPWRGPEEVTDEYFASAL